MLCPNCHIEISVHDHFCGEREGDGTKEGAIAKGYCASPNPGYQSKDSLGKSTYKNITGKLSEILIYELIGIFLLVGLPFLGLPSLPLLAAVLMALFPFYSFLPNERQAIASRGIDFTGKEGESLGAWAAGSLMLKGIVKMTAFVLTVLQFIPPLGIPVSTLIPLAISFVYYFTLPVEYKVTQPFKMIEAWFRIGVGGLISWFMLLAFSYTPQAWALALMSAAFFVTSFPHHKEAEEEGGVVRVKIEVLKKVANNSYLEPIMKVFFLVLMIIAFAVSGIGLGTSGFQLIFLVVWIMSVISGWAAGTEGRPALGILMIGVTLFVFSFTATGVIGQAVFGYWWPQIESFSESITAPLAPMIAQMQSTMSDSWMMLTNPMGYYDMIQKRDQTVSIVMVGGTTSSIDLKKTDLFTSVDGKLEPLVDPVIGSFEIENSGQFDAKSINLTLWASWEDATKVSVVNPTWSTPVGSLDSTKFSCSKPALSATGTVTGGIGVCNWTEVTYPKEIKVVNFVFTPNKWGFLANCVEKTPDGTSYICPSDQNSNGDPSCCQSSNDYNAENATYVYSGQTVKVNVNLTYDYNVNVSMPVDVINSDRYRTLLLEKQITLNQITSNYTGGPIKASLWSQSQPIRSGEESLFVASLYNDGDGILSRVMDFKINIPAELAENVILVSKTFKRTSAFDPDGCALNQPVTTQQPGIRGQTSNQPQLYWTIDCVNNFPMKAGEFKRVSFYLIPSDVPIEKTSQITGLATYEYVKTGSTTIQVANAPMH